MNLNKFVTFCLLKTGKRNIPKILEFLKKNEYNSLENNLSIQEEKLKEILLHAYNHVPYYHRLLGKTKVIAEGKVNLNNFNKIPILTKEIIRKNFERLKSTDKNYKKRVPYLNTTGGSTGEPVSFIQDNHSYTHGMAGAWLFQTFTKQSICVKKIMLWGSERDILEGSIGLKNRIKNWIFNKKILNTFKMSETDMKNYINKINSYKPILIEAYVQSVYELCKFIEKNNLKVYSPKGIITSAGTLYPEMKKTIEKVFKCKVFNRYGSREVGSIACSCKEDNGLHLNIFDHYVEILNNNLKPCSPGQLGKVYITTLNNYSMPLIRYENGDVAVPSKNQQCACGRGLPLIKSVRGRISSMIKTRKGTFDGTALTTSFYFFDSIKKYQFVQKKIDQIEIKVILNDKELWKDDEKKLKSKLKKILGEDVSITFNIVNKINPSKSGKYLYFINETKK